MEALNMDLKLEPVLANIIQQLANFFGTTTNAVMDNAPEFLAKYGWFTTLSNIGANLFMNVVLMLIVGLLVGFIISFINDEFYYNKETKINLIKWCFGITIAGVIIMIVADILPCLIAPELVGLQQLLRLFEIYM